MGKNKSGKTTLLTALYRLSPIFGDSIFDRQQDYPRRYLSDYDARHDGKDPNVVTTWWAIEPAEKKTIAEKFGARALRSDTVMVQRGYGPTTNWAIGTDEPAIVKHLIDTSDLNDEEIAKIGVVGTVAGLKAKVATVTEATARQTQLIQRIDQDLPESSVFKGMIKLLSLPKFMLFSQYQRMQGRVSLDEIQAKKAAGTLNGDDQVFVALCDMAGVTLEQAASLQDFEAAVSRFEGASNKISAEIFRYWSQNRFLKVVFRLDPALPGDPPPFNAGRVFRTRIHNRLHEVTVPFDDRSTGFVWFFSFLALFSQVKKSHSLSRREDHFAAG